MGFYNFTNGTSADAEQVDSNFDNVVNFTMLSNYKVLQSNNVFQNDNLFVTDEFLDSNGTNNTVDTGNTTAVYRVGTDDYALFGATGNSEGDAQNNVNIGNVNSASVTGTIDSSSGFFSQIQFRPFLATSSNYTLTIQKGATTVATKNINTTTTSIVNIDLVRSDYSQLLSNTDTFTITLSGDSGESFQYRTTTTSFTGTYFSWTGQNPIHSNTTTGDWVTFTEYVEVSSPAVIEVDTGVTLDGTEAFANLFADVTQDTNTSCEVRFSDGTTTTTASVLDSYGFSGNVDISSLSTGTLTAYVDLKTTDSTETPEVRGISMGVLR